MTTNRLLALALVLQVVTLAAGSWATLTLLRSTEAAASSADDARHEAASIGRLVPVRCAAP